MQAAFKDFELAEDKEERELISAHIYFHFHWLKLIDQSKANIDNFEELTTKALKLSQEGKNAPIFNENQTTI